MCKLFLKKFGYFTSSDEIRLFWWKGQNGKNFGDALGPYLVQKISKKKPVYVNRHCQTPYYRTVGSIMSKMNSHTQVWGSGILSTKQKINRPMAVFSVRGPKTRDALLKQGIPCPEIYGDPALLLPIFYKPKTTKRYDLGIIPHYVDYEIIQNRFRDKNVKIINLLDPIETVIDDINSCNATISSSLHGIIVSHAYGIPSMWVEFSKRLCGDGVKFEDYFLSVGLVPYKPLDYSDTDPSCSEIIKKIETHHGQKICIDTKKIINACPFRTCDY